MTTSRLLQLQPRPRQLCVEDLWGMALGRLSVLQKYGQVGPLARPSRRREHVSPVRNGTSGDARNGDLLQFTPNRTRIPAGRHLLMMAM